MQAILIYFYSLYWYGVNFMKNIFAFSSFFYNKYGDAALKTIMEQSVHWVEEQLKREEKWIALEKYLSCWERLSLGIKGGH